MSLARLVVTAVRVEGQTKAEVARNYGVSPRWVYELVRRFDAEGGAGLEPRSRRPHRSSRRTAEELENEIVELRKGLLDQGLDAGAHTIAYHLSRRHGEAAVPSPATIWRILSRRGFVISQPQKRPQSSFVRFEASMPNERWQADLTHWKLAGGAGVEILNVIDDHSRFLLASVAREVFKAGDVVAAFHGAGAAHGFRRRCSPTMGRCSRRHHATAAARWRPSWIGWGSASPTPVRTILRPAARSRVPPDPQALAPQAGAGPDGRRAAGRSGPVPGVLRRRAAAPSDRTAHPRAGVQCATEGGSGLARVHGASALPGTARQDRQHRCDHAASRLTAAPHRAGPGSDRDAGPRTGRRPSRSCAERGWRADPGAHARSGPRLPAARAEVRWKDLPRHVGTMSRDITWGDRGDSNPQPPGPQPGALTD